MSKSVWHSSLSLVSDRSVPLETFDIFNLLLANTTDVNHWFWINVVALDEMAHQVPLVLVRYITQVASRHLCNVYLGKWLDQVINWVRGCSVGLRHIVSLNHLLWSTDYEILYYIIKQIIIFTWLINKHLYLK